MKNNKDLKIGLICSTFGSPQFVHLQLETRKRWYPDVPTIVVDDHSSQAETIKKLCDAYNVVFYSRRERRGHTAGDLSAFCESIDFSHKRGLQYMVKQSRRLILLQNWVPDLKALIESTGQKAIYSRECKVHKFPIRTELCAINTEKFKPYRNYIYNDKSPVFSPQNKSGKIAEFFIDGVVRRMEEKNGTSERGFWDILPDRRTEHKEGIIWHEADGSFPYVELSKFYGFKYDLEDFKYPNGAESHKY